MTIHHIPLKPYPHYNPPFATTSQQRTLSMIPYPHHNTLPVPQPHNNVPKLGIPTPTTTPYPCHNLKTMHHIHVTPPQHPTFATKPSRLLPVWTSGGDLMSPSILTPMAASPLVTSHGRKGLASTLSPPPHTFSC